MPRIARIQSPGTFRQVISLFTDKEYRLSDAGRDAYLRRLRRYIDRSDWRLVCYALMSTHIHIGAFGGHTPLSEIFRPLHSSMAAWLNRSGGRRGHVFADRPDEFLYEPRLVPAVIAYIHNNPVKAGVVTMASASTWTSHRAYLGLEEAPDWLDVDAGLQACGLATSDAGRKAFDGFVRGRAGDEPVYPSRGEVTAFRAAVRAETDCPVELAGPAFEGTDRSRWELLSPGSLPRERRWQGDLEDLLIRVQLVTGVSVEAMHSRSRAREVVEARRIYLLTANRYLGRSLTEASGVIGRSVQTGSKLLGSEAAYRGAFRATAARIARECWESDTSPLKG